MTSDASAALVAARLLVASLAVAVIPGALIVLAWRPRREVTVVELAALGIATSVIVVQILTIAAVVLHRSIEVMLAVLALITLAHGVVAVRRRGVLVRFPRGEWIFAGALTLVAALLYVAGSPYGSTEDAIHIAIVRRLRFLDTTALDNIYVVPGVVYTYPFPGTHYLMAAISRLADLDPLFVYHKLRGLWGFAALTLLYACARLLFESQRMALASALVAIVLVANGSFAGVPDFYWGQLAPYSHASDVAMGVLLPALLLLALHVFRAQSTRDTTWFFAATGGLVLMLTMVHIREVVQFVSYLAAFLVALLIVRRDVRLLTLAGGLLVLTVATLLIYNAWHQSIASGVERLVQENRRGLLAIAGRMSLRDWLRPGIAVVGGYIPAFDAFFYGWNPIVLLGAAGLLLRRRMHAAMLLVGASILTFAAILRFGPLTWAYVYATYFEVLYTPVRNVIFFVHLSAGALLYAAAERIAGRSSIAAAAGLAVVTAVAMAVAYRHLGGHMARSHDLLWIPLLLGYAAAAWWLRRHPGEAVGPTSSGAEVTRLTTAVAVGLALCAGIVSWNAASSPVTALSETTWATPHALLQASGCRDDDSFTVSYTPPGVKPIEVSGLLSCPPPPSLIRFAESELSVHAVLAVDKYDQYSPAMYMPQRMDAWPGQGDGLLNQRELFAPYFRFYDAAVARYGEQPFFNTKETDDERSAFVEGLGITHVLVNPRFHATMTALLDGFPDRYRRRYDDGRWAIYEVRQ